MRRGIPIFFQLLLVVGFIPESRSLAQVSPATETERLSVAVLWFNNQTGDPNYACWSEGITGLIGTSLRSVKAVRLLSDTAITYAREQAGLVPGISLDPNQAQAIGMHIEAQRVIWGSYRQQGTKWRVDLNILNVATGQLYQPKTVNESDWFRIRDALVQSILTQLEIEPTPKEWAGIRKRGINSELALENFIQTYWLQSLHRPLPEQYAYLRIAVEADPNSALLCASMGGALAAEGKLAEAEEYMRRAVTLDPNEFMAHYALGFLLTSQGELTEASQCFERACSLRPDFAECQVLLARVWGFQQQWDKAANLAEQACALEPFNAECHAHLAGIYTQQQKRDAALEQSRLAEQYCLQGVSRANVWLVLADTYLHLGEKPRAIHALQQLIVVAEEMQFNADQITPYKKQLDRVQASLVPTFLRAPKPRDYTEETLTQTLCNSLNDDEMKRVRYPFTCTASMEAWARELTHDAQTDLDKAKKLFDGLSRRIESGQGMQTRTAAEVYTVWDQPLERLWCVDYTVLYVALARAVGLDAFFTYVMKDNNGRVVLHACATVFVDGQVVLADATYQWFGVPHQRFEIKDDLYVIAYYLSASDDSWVEDCELALKLEPNLMTARMRLLRHEDPNTARQKLETMSEPDPNTYEAYLYWLDHGRIAAYDNDVERIESSLRKAIKIAPQEPEAHYNLGRLFQLQGRLAEAQKEFRQSLDDRSAETTARAQRHLAEISEELWTTRKAKGNRSPAYFEEK